MDTLLLGITIVSLIVALVASLSMWRLARAERRRAAARVAALGAAADDLALAIEADAPAEKGPGAREGDRAPFGGAYAVAQTGGGRQRTLAAAAVALFIILSLGVVWTMSGPRGTTPRAMGPNHPIELLSLRHERQATRLAISGLVRNPPAGVPIERVSAVVLLFDRAGAFVASAKAPLDFVKIGAGDESPFVVIVEAPPTVVRYRVSFRADDETVPHVDRRGQPPAATPGEQPASVSLK